MPAVALSPICAMPIVTKADKKREWYAR